MQNRGGRNRFNIRVLLYHSIIHTIIPSSHVSSHTPCPLTPFHHSPFPTFTPPPVPSLYTTLTYTQHTHTKYVRLDCYYILIFFILVWFLAGRYFFIFYFLFFIFYFLFIFRMARFVNIDLIVYYYMFKANDMHV